MRVWEVIGLCVLKKVSARKERAPESKRLFNSFYSSCRVVSLKATWLAWKAKKNYGWTLDLAWASVGEAKALRYRGWSFRGNVEKVIDGKDQRGAKQELLENLDLVQVLDRDVENLSGWLYTDTDEGNYELKTWCPTVVYKVQSLNVAESFICWNKIFSHRYIWEHRLQQTITNW